MVSGPDLTPLKRLFPPPSKRRGDGEIPNYQSPHYNPRTQDDRKHQGCLFEARCENQGVKSFVVRGEKVEDLIEVFVCFLILSSL